MVIVHHFDGSVKAVVDTVSGASAIQVTQKGHYKTKRERSVVVGGILPEQAQHTPKQNAPVWESALE